MTRSRAVTLSLLAGALLCLTCVPAVWAAGPDSSRYAGRWPLSPRPEVIRAFEPPPRPWLSGHRGVDLAGAPGQAVHAPVTGTVSYAGPLAGRGVIVLTHGATRTTYEPVVAAVHVGQLIAAGHPIGRLSGAGSHCGPRACLHWGLRQGDEYLDPLSLLTVSPVRLLPLRDSAAWVTRWESAPSNPGRPGPALPTSRAGPQSGVPTGLDQSAIAPAPAPAGIPAGDSAGGAAGVIVIGLTALVTVGGAVLLRRY
ncbi:MAG: murein hydrolase activator EnvC family protein [Kribbellaceae bacterium]